MEKIKVEIKKIKVKDLLEMVNILTLLDHQRAYKKRSDDLNNMKNVLLLNELISEIVLSDLQSNYEYSIENNLSYDISVFKKELDKGMKYSIEDGNHRINTIIRLFKTLTQEEIDLLNESDIYLKIIYNTDLKRLIRMFGNINNGSQITKSDIIWGDISKINISIKDIISKKIYKELYKRGDIFDTNYKRKIHKFFVETMLLCGYYDKIHNISTLKKNNIKTFLEISDINTYDYLSPLYSSWFDYIIDLDRRNEFVLQTNLMFILHIFKNENIELNKEKVYSILNELTNTRRDSFVRYKEILQLIKKK